MNAMHCICESEHPNTAMHAVFAAFQNATSHFHLNVLWSLSAQENKSILSKPLPKQLPATVQARNLMSKCR